MKIDTGSTAWMLAATALVLLMTPGLAFFYGGMTRAKSVLNMMMMSWVAIITVTITAWMLAATALVLLMTPGLAFFYGGMTRAKSVLNMMMMSWVAIITVTIAWVLYGDSLSFGKGNGFIGGFEYLGEHGLVHDASRVSGIPDLIFSAFQLTFAVITVALINGFIGGFEYLGEHGLVHDASRVSGIPDLIFSAFQLTFAVITVALISGAIADRTKFGAWAVFTVAWATLVYFPVAHWVWGGGWLSSLGIEDFAGGTVVHVNAGSAGLALAIVLGKRRGWPKGARQTAGLRQGPDAPAQPAAGPARRGPAVVRLVRLQRGLGASRGRNRRPRVHEHPDRDRGRGRRLAARRAVP